MDSILRKKILSNTFLFTNTMSPYLSIDCETTGLDCQEHQIIEVSAVFDPDGVTPIENLIHFRGLFKRDEYLGQEVALEMNKKVIEEAKKHGFDERTIKKQFNHFLLSVLKILDKDKITVAGKNFASFDAGFLYNFDPNLKTIFNHRQMDVGNVYYSYFDKIPSLKEINELLFEESHVAHSAYLDAVNVIYAHRFEHNLRKYLVSQRLKGSVTSQVFESFLTRALKT